MTSSDVTVLWDGISHNRNITGYSVRYGVQGSGSLQIVYVPGAATTETTISELNSATTYSIEVVAVNSDGIENDNVPITVKTEGIHFIQCLFVKLDT